MANIGWAVEQCKDGSKARRPSWAQKGMFIKMKAPDEKSDMSLPYIWIMTGQDNKVPWTPTQNDLIATDWEAA